MFKIQNFVESFSKKNRLVQPGAFVQLKSRKALSKTSATFLLRWIPNSGIEEKKIGIVISRKVGTAVQRNLIKRIVRDSFRRGREKFPQADLVVICRPPLKNLRRTDIRREFEKLVDSIH